MDHQTDLRFGLHLQRLREQRGWSQEAFAAKLQVAGHDMSRGTLAKIEAGIRHVYLEDLFAFQRVLEVPFDELLRLETK